MLLLKDRMDRDDNVYTTSTGHARSLNDYLASGQVLVGVEGNEWILPYVIKQCGAEAFAYASDYPHWDTEFPENIEHLSRREDLDEDAKKWLLAESAKKLYNLQ